jgi:preprotein translocase SecE subunit
VRPQQYGDAGAAFGSEDAAPADDLAAAAVPGVTPEPVAPIADDAAEFPEGADVFEDEISGTVAEAAAEGREVDGSRKGNRVFAFLRASWAELKRVQWPDRRAVFQATAVVLGFVVIAGAYLGLADYVAQKIVNAIL